MFDVTLEAGKEKYKCHKVVLSIRSDVFKAMFKHGDMEENRTDSVKIRDVNSQILKKMIDYIYMDKVVDDLSGELLAASDKYNLQGLKDGCEAFLCRNANEKNVIHLFQLAYLHNTPGLQNVTMQIIKDHHDKLSKSPEWREMKERYPDALDFMVSLLSI